MAFFHGLVAHRPCLLIDGGTTMDLLESIKVPEHLNLSVSARMSAFLHKQL